MISRDITAETVREEGRSGNYESKDGNSVYECGTG